MADREQQLTAFFAGYEARTNDALTAPDTLDLDAVTSAFADCFVGANPAGVRCGKNDETFRAAILKGFAFYRSIGTRRMAIRGLRVIDLDEHHVIARVQWEAFYRRRSGRELTIRFEVAYAVQLRDEQPRIFAYVTGDEQGEYAKNGLTPE